MIRILKLYVELADENIEMCSTIGMSDNSFAVADDKNQMIQNQTAIISLILAFAALFVALYSNVSSLRTKVLGLYVKSHRSNKNAYTTYIAVCNVTPNSVIEGKGKNVRLPLTYLAKNDCHSKVEIINAGIVTNMIECEYMPKTEKGFAHPAAAISPNRKCVTIKFDKLSYGDWFILKLEHTGKIKSDFRFEYDIFGVAVEAEYKKIDSLLSKAYIPVTFVTASLILISVYITITTGSIWLLVVSLMLSATYYVLALLINKTRVPYFLRKKVRKLINSK